MPDERDINEIRQSTQQQQNPEQTLEQLLLNLLNPVRLSRQRIRVQNFPDSDVLYEIREAVIISPEGVLEELQELVINTDTFDDASPKNIFGLLNCPSCGSTVREGSIVICQHCRKICCAVEGCGTYSRSRNAWYCCGWHAFLGFLGISLRI
jgi:hypothetical protein